MRLLRSIFNFYLNSSIHVGIEVCCFVGITFLRFDLPVDWKFIGFVFFGTVTGYNFIKYAGVAKLYHKSLTKNLRFIQLFSLFCFLAFAYFALQVSLGVLLLSVFFGFFTVFYTVPFLSGKSLRNIKGLKIFVIAFVVTGLTVVVPLLHFSGKSQMPMLNEETILTVFQRLAFIIAVIIPFEIRDLEVDQAELGTIPQKIGIKNAKLLGLGLLAIFLILEFLKPGVSSAAWISVIIISLVTAGFILFSKRRQSEYFASFWVEAIPIFWFLVFWLLARVIA